MIALLANHGTSRPREFTFARIVNLRGREIWSRKLSAGSHLLPASGGGGWLVLRFEGAVQALPIGPDLR